MVPATVGSLLAERIGWRSGFLVTPVLAILVVAITVRYVPETRSSHRRTDVLGLFLVTVALIGLTYGISGLQKVWTWRRRLRSWSGSSPQPRSCGGNCAATIPRWTCESFGHRGSTPW